MSQFAACMTDLSETALAERYYYFIQEKGEIPDDDCIHFLIKNSDDLDDACHQINSQFMIHLKDALLNAVSAANRDVFSQQLIIEEYLDDTSPEFDKLTIRFQDRVLYNPMADEVEDLYHYMAQIDACLHSSGAKFEPTYALDVTTNIIEKIKGIADEGILVPLVDSSGGKAKTIIIELRFIQELAATNKNSQQALESIWKILCDFKPELLRLQYINPSLLLLNGSPDSSL